MSALTTFIFAITFLNCTHAAIPNTNGYQVTQSQGHSKCGAAVGSSSPTLHVDEVAKNWKNRGDYTDSSLEKLKTFELKLKSDRVNWISLISESGQVEARIRIFDGRKINGSGSADTSYLVPTEIKFPGIEIRIHLKRNVVELGLLDVEQQTDGGMAALFHHVAKFLKENMGLDDLSIVITAREANAKLYNSRVGFEYIHLSNGEKMQTPDGMYVMKMDASLFAVKYYGKRLYPVKRGNTDEWREYFAQQMERVHILKAKLTSVATQIYQMQGHTFLGVQQVSRVVNAVELARQWETQAQLAHDLLIEEKFEEFEEVLREISTSIWDYTPVVVGETLYESSIGSGRYRINRTVRLPIYDFQGHPFRHTLKFGE